MVPVKEENEREVHLTTVSRGGGHLTPSELLRLVEVKLGVEAPPALVVLVNSLSSD